MNRFISLKERMLLIFGSLMILLMMIISLSVLYNWRRLIINDRLESTRSIAQSLSSSVLDAMIYQHNELRAAEAYLENYVLNFSSRNEQVMFIAVLAPNGKVVAHSDVQALGKTLDYPEPVVQNSSLPVTFIFHHARMGWLAECDYPLRTGNKLWGTLQVGLNAQPIRRLFWLLLILTSASVLIVLAVIYFLTQRLTSSLSSFVKEMDRYDLHNSIPSSLPADNDEIGFLIRHFRSMQYRLEASRQQLILAQKQIYQAEKLASVGRLASGVAHEVNNPLNGIKNCLYAIRREPDDMGQTLIYLDLMDEGLNHVELVVQKLLRFSRQESVHRQAINLNEQIDPVLSLLHYRLEQKGVRIELELQVNLPDIYADRQQIQEVLMNLLINSFDALGDEGQITIKTYSDAPHHVIIEIHDNGPGISAGIADKIFDPFFTTKEEGKGTGLGLSVSLGIIEAHGGGIVHQSAAGNTIFKITLPALQPEV